MKGLLTLMFVIVTATNAGAQDVVGAAKKVVNSFNNDQKKKAVFVATDEERLNWNFVPVPRQGIPLAELTEDQKKQVRDLLKLSLSEQGYTKATNINTLEGVLRVVEGRSEGDGYRDPGKYFTSFFGTPETKGAWGWRFEGHHLSLNFYVIEGVIVSSTPSFMGSNPAVVPSGEKKGWQVLKDETEFGLELVNSLTPEQQKVAIFSDRALPEIVTGNDRQAKLIEPKGVAYKELNADQQKAFIKLLNVFVKNYELGFSSKLWDKIQKAGVDNLTFAWAGSTTPGSGTYYRIQGPMLQIEYDNTQTKANHVHTAVRDLTNDFAVDILKAHYDKEH